ncbi:MAG: hypothetical protein J2P21_30345, partial [Chloracidobacterium sp.]|nr:hypothetical protein [Chloracidobacterium sp.]
MGLTSVPIGDDAAPIHEAADVFVSAGVAPVDVGDYEQDYYQRKAAQGSRYPLTLKILREDLPGWARGKRKRAEAAQPAVMTAARPPVVTAPANYRQSRHKGAE